jgi:hypothetical protein
LQCVKCRATRIWFFDPRLQRTLSSIQRKSSVGCVTILYVSADGEAADCQAEDAIAAQCKHVFDRDCIRQYLETAVGEKKAPECPVCHVGISIDLEAEAIEINEDSKKARQGILGRLDIEVSPIPTVYGR